MATVNLNGSVISKRGQESILFYIHMVGGMPVVKGLSMSDRKGRAILAVNILINITA